MCRVTILELFPLYFSARKWGSSSPKEIVRLEKEFTIVTSSRFLKKSTIDNLYHKKDGPAIIWYYANGKTESERWFIYNKEYRKYGPTYIEYYDNSQVKYESWMTKCKYYREDGQYSFAYIEYYDNGQVRKEYRMNEKLYKLAWIEYYKNSKIKEKCWYLNEI